MNVLLTGAGGQLGRALQASPPAGWRLTALGRAQLDITDADAVRETVARQRPQLIVNAAAYNAVDRAEQESGPAFAVNAQGPLNLARAANGVGARLVHVSTDYVFDGRTRRPYDEHAAPHPLNEYGRSKLLGEQQALRAQPQALVLRTAWVYGAQGANFVRTMLELAARGQPLRVVDDQTGCPTCAGDLAAAIAALASLPAVPGGIYHYCGATALTRHDFALAILRTADSMAPVAPRRASLLRPIASSQYPSAAPRPAYSVLGCGKMAALGIPPRPLEDTLPEVVRAILADMRPVPRA